MLHKSINRKKQKSNKKQAHMVLLVLPKVGLGSIFTLYFAAKL